MNIYVHTPRLLLLVATLAFGANGCIVPNSPKDTRAHGFTLSAEQMAPVMEHVNAISTLCQQIRIERAQVPASEQDTWGFMLLDLAVGSHTSASASAGASANTSEGRVGLVTNTLSDWALGGDIEALVFLAMLQASEDAKKDLRQAVEEIGEANEARKRLRDSVNALRAEQEALKSAMREAYEKADRRMDAAQWELGLGISEAFRMGIPVGAVQDEENEASYSVDANLGGTVIAKLDCGNGPNDPGAATVRITNAFDDSTLAEAKTDSGSATAVAQLPANVPTALRVVMRTGVNNQLGVRLCTLQLEYTKRVQPLSPIGQDERNAFAALVQPRAKVIADLQSAFATAQKIKLATDDLKALSGFLTRTTRDLNRSAEPMTYAEAKEAKQEMRDQKDSLSEMGEMDMLMMQQLLEKKTQLEQMISNVMKAAYEGGQAAIEALKAS